MYVYMLSDRKVLVKSCNYLRRPFMVCWEPSRKRLSEFAKVTFLFAKGYHFLFSLANMISPSNRRSVFAYHVVLCTATHLPVRPGRSASHQLMQRILRKNRCEVEQACETKQLRKTYLYRDVCTWKSKCKKKYALHNIVYTDVAVDLFQCCQLLRSFEMRWTCSCDIAMGR